MRRPTNVPENLVRLPWWLGVSLGVIVGLAISHGLPALIGISAPEGRLPQRPDVFEQRFLLSGAAAMLLCWLATGSSWFASHRRRKPLHPQRGLDSLSELNWKDFEQMIGEAYRRQGWQVQETGLGGRDGGVDLILRRNDEIRLVQCKQWRRQQLPMALVREMWELARHYRAGGVILACVGGYSRDAQAFAAGKAIELVTGDALAALIGSARGRAMPQLPGTLDGHRPRPRGPAMVRTSRYA